MKRKLKILFMIMAFSLLCLATAYADEPEVSGIYDLAQDSGYTASALSFSVAESDGTAITGESATIKDASTTFYPNAAKITVSNIVSEDGKYYLFLGLSGSATPGDSNIVYIDQKTATGGTIEFTLYPSALSGDTTYYIRMASNTTNGAIATLAAFNYYEPYKKGDVDGNGDITSTDAISALQISVGLGSFTDAQKVRADVDGNGDVTSTDALAILKLSVGL